jgi:midasin
MSPEPKEYQQQSAASSTAGAAAAGPRQDQGQANAEFEAQVETNPLRSLGDAIKEIRQRFDEILSGEKREVQKQTSDVSTAPQVEYLQPDDGDYEMQALGPAGEEQTARLDDLHLIDDDVPGADVNQMDVDVAPQEQHDEAPQPTQPLSTIVPDARTLKDDIEGAVMHDPDIGRKQPVKEFDHSLPKATSEMEDERQSVEVQLVEWQSLGFPEERGEHVWRLYESLTHDLAYALCEQLRLVLEPTLATRLKGDYRTGKRLNMKKIIPYIASDYTKDKIWLRRTKPSQREYQVLIAIDDSRSMAESHSIHLAFQTLALVAKALTRLESGDVAIASFGEAVHMLHSFEDGQFTDQAGTKVISSFHFNQKATNVLALVETSLKVLESARDRRSMSSATAGDLWQLEIIISDGLCQDHDRLQALLRKAEEQRVMFVFIIVDSLHSASRSTTQNSILHMDKAEYKLVDGRMELQLQKYLHTFPFEYYVVLRNVEALPDVLAGTLKQFFERISES